jgi:hypothetical protein
MFKLATTKITILNWLKGKLITISNEIFYLEYCRGNTAALLMSLGTSEGQLTYRCSQLKNYFSEQCITAKSIRQSINQSKTQNQILPLTRYANICFSYCPGLQYQLLFLFIFLSYFSNFFSSIFSYFSPQMTSGDTPPPREGEILFS